MSQKHLVKPHSYNTMSELLRNFNCWNVDIAIYLLLST